jgi:hypothetical protein
MPRSHHSPGLLLLVALLAASAIRVVAAPDWESTVTALTPASIPPPRSVRTHNDIRSTSITAATGHIRFRQARARLEFDATGGTIGLVKRLWPYQVTHRATCEAHTLRPREVREQETMQNLELKTVLAFTPRGVTSQREARQDSAVKSKTRTFDFPNVHSLNSAFLLLRSHPLTDGSVQRTVVYPSTSAYLCTITSLGRERITVPAGSYDALKLDVQIQKIGKKRELLPHKRLRKATVWLSDDADRLVLRIEAQVFIGMVFVELQSVQFDNGHP